VGDVTTAEFVAYLCMLDIRISIHGERLRCNAPKGVLTDGLRQELTARKVEILGWLRANSDGLDVAAGDVPSHVVGGLGTLGLGRTRTPRDGDLPLSFAQQRLWFLDQLEPGTSAYTLAVRRRFHDPLDVTALASACTELARRHESLRTTFVSRDGQPVQRIADPKPVALELIDLESVLQEDRAGAANRIIQEQAQQPFDLAHGPLFRPLLIRLGPDDHELLMSVHHIIADGWSLDILARELDVLYEALVTGRPSPLPELPIQYMDFVLWQRRRLTGDVLQTKLRHWRGRLTGPLTPAELPTDHPRGLRSTAAGASHWFALPHPLTQRLRELSHRERTTPFMTLLAAFKALLARYTGQEDIVVGTAVANRNDMELEPVVGFFANTLALRTDLGGDPTFRELLARVRETCLDAYAHQDMPFEQLVEELQPERTLGQNPLFQVNFVWQDATTGADLAYAPVSSPFDLTLFIRDGTDGTLSATVRYKRDLFEPETIARLAGHYRTLLEGVAADPDRRLAALPLLSEAEAHRLLIECNATATPYPCDRSVHALFEDQVEATPDAVALAFEGASLTYRALDRRANRLAHHLRALGVGPERLVGVWMERSVDMIVALLGILKAGGAYLPFDLLAPRARLAFMLSDAKVDLLLTQERMLPRLPPHAVRTLCLDAGGDGIWAQPDTRLGGSVGADGLAYVMYTSGSTGEPKGVAVTHRNVVRLVKNTDYAHFGSDEVSLQLAPLSFDASTFEIWGALLNGGRLAIAPPGVLSVEELGAVLARYGVTTLWLTAGLFHQVVDRRIEILCSLHQLLTGGDVLSPAHVKRMLEALPGCRLINGYGPSENTTFTCCHTVTNATSHGRSVPIGRPIANTRVYVLDRHLRPVPIGVPGELWIAGDGVARGYVDRPALTAERFVVHRFSETLEERLYRSGDLVRWLSDGTLEFLGRLDDQVKVRGYRVEPGEIEATLSRHRRVREVAVVAHRTGGGDRYLVAYIVGDGSVDPHDLREFLRSKLPDYMVPAAFLALDRLPLTANGKVDRQALPAPEANAGTVDSSAEPQDELEQKLVKIWQDVLAVNLIAIHDNFFDLGGHSLLAVQMFAQLEEQLGVTLPLATLFQAPTIAGLAAFIRRGARPASRRSLVPIQPAGSRSPVFGMPGVGGNVLAYNALARLMGPDQPFYGLQSRGLDGIEGPLIRVEDIASAFLHEVRQVQPEGPYYLIGMCMGGVVAYEMAQQLRAERQKIGLLVLLETWPPQATSARRFRFRAHVPAVLGFAVDRLRLYLETLARLSGREQLRYLLGRLKLCTEIIVRRDLFRGARGEFHQGLVTQANLLAYQQYQPCVYPGPVVLFWAEGRKVGLGADYRFAWRELATGGLEVYSMPGADSGLMLRDPHVQLVASQLKMYLERAQALASPAGPRA